MRSQTWIAACCAVMISACSGDPVDGNPGDVTVNPVASADETVLRLRVVDSESVPLPGMVPIVAEGPSLLADAVSQGSPTDADGVSVALFPRYKWVYVRAVDPAGTWIAADYVELEPGDAPESDEPVDLMMEMAASVLATLQTQDGSPIAGETAGLLMLHPAHGQWWRAESSIDESGGVRFTGLPAGVFALKIQLDDVGTATFREVVLTGGEAEDLGVVSPQPSE